MKNFQHFAIVFFFISTITSYEACNYTKTPISNDQVIIARNNSDDYLLIGTQNRYLAIYDYPYYTLKDTQYLSSDIKDITFLRYYSSYNYFAVAMSNDIYIYRFYYSSITSQRTISNVHSTGTINCLGDISVTTRLISGGTDTKAMIRQYYSSSSSNDYELDHNYQVKFVLSVATSYYYRYKVVTVTSDNSLHYWYSSSSKYTWNPHSSTVVGLIQSNNHIVTADSGGKIVWSYVYSSQGNMQYSQTHSRSIVGIASYYSSEDYKYYIAVIDSSGYLSVWNYLSGKKKEFKVKEASKGMNGIVAIESYYNKNLIVLPKTSSFEIWNISKSSTHTDKTTGLCVTGCPSNQYLSSGSYCSDCSTKCKTCIGSYGNCSSCNSPNILMKDSSYSSYNYMTCAPCGGSNCKTCQSTYLCSSCNEGYYLPYAVPGTCKVCYDADCAVCEPTDYRTCHSCKTGYYKKSYSSYDSCSSCYYKCKTCSAYGSTKCTSCKSGYKLSSGKCNLDNSSVIGGIIGGVIGGIAFIILIICLSVYSAKKRAQKYQGGGGGGNNIAVIRIPQNVDQPNEINNEEILIQQLQITPPTNNPIPTIPVMSNPLAMNNPNVQSPPKMNPMPLNNPDAYNNPNYMYPQNYDPNVYNPYPADPMYQPPNYPANYPENNLYNMPQNYPENNPYPPMYAQNNLYYPQNFNPNMSDATQQMHNPYNN